MIRARPQLVQAMSSNSTNNNLMRFSAYYCNKSEDYRESKSRFLLERIFCDEIY